MPPATRVWRIEVHPALAHDDPIGRSAAQEAIDLQLADGTLAVHSARVYLIQAALTQQDVERVAAELLADPINQRRVLGSSAVDPATPLIEVHYLPGVMDPVAQSTAEAIVEMLGGAIAEVRTGERYVFEGVSAETARTIADRLLANTVIQSVATTARHPDHFVEVVHTNFRSPMCRSAIWMMQVWIA